MEKLAFKKRKIKKQKNSYYKAVLKLFKNFYLKLFAFKVMTIQNFEK
jgi:hypothetical protein